MAQYKEKVKNYSADLQKLFIEFMITDPSLYVRVANITRTKFFVKNLAPAIKFIWDHSREHNAVPTVEQIKAETGVELNKVPDIDDRHKEWFMKEYETFCRHKALEIAIIDSTDLLEQGDYGVVEEKIKNAVRIGLTRDLGTEYFLDPKARLLALKDNNGTISTGWKGLDKKLYGGFNKGELNIFAGQSGAGKSLFLQNLALNWVMTGLNVVYFTFELSEELSAMRIDSMTTDIPTGDIFKKIDDVDLQVRMVGKKAGKLQVKYLPSGVNANDLRTYIREYTVQTNIKVDCICVDYLDLLMPISKRIAPSDLYIKDKYVAEELRNLAVELEVPLATASQLNRTSIEEIEFDQSHIAGGLSKIQTADNVIGIFTSRAMRERGRYQLQLIKTRSSGGVGSKIDLAFDVDNLKITDLDDSEIEDTVATSSSNVLDNIKKRTSTVSNKSEGAQVVEKVEEVAKLRDLLKSKKSAFDSED
jgi:archaellum biogenesis ATPase FlaH